MKAIFLGTNGWYDTETGNTPSILLDAKSCYIVLDAGNGIYKLNKYITKKKPVYLFISHLHLDHIVGLHILNKFNFAGKLSIFGPAGIKRYLKLIVNKPFTAPFSQLSFRTDIYDLKEGKYARPFKFECRKLLHPVRCFGYRFEIDGKTVAYCTDTGTCSNVIKLAQKADLFISECSYLPGQDSAGWPHLNPEEAAKMATQARPKKMVLFHFDAEAYPHLALRKQAGKVAKKIFPHTVVGFDGLKIKIT